MAKRKSRAALSPEEKRPLNKQSFGKLAKIFKFVLPYKFIFVAGMVCLFFSSVTLLGFPFASGKLVDAATGASDWILNDLNKISLALVGILLVQSIFSFLRVYLFAQVSERAMADVRHTLYRKLMSLPMSFFDGRRTGELISRVTSDISLLQDTFSVTLAEFFRQIATLIVGIFLIFYMTPKLALFMLATFPVLVLLAMVFGRFIRRLSKQSQDELANANVVVEETLQSVSAVKAFTSERFEVNRYRSSLDKVVKVALKGATYRGAFISFIIFALFGGIVAVMSYGAHLVQAGEMTVGDLISFVLYTTFIGASIAGLGDLYGQIQKAIGASERVLEILEERSELDLEKEEKPSIPLSGNIVYRNISFSYPGRSDVKVLKNIDLQIGNGEKIALVGQSGAGKSTIVQLLMRFYDFQKGSLQIDGKDIKSYDLNAYRENIGIVPQEVLLFGGSIRENIAYGKSGATDEEIYEAARKANALNFIEKFPEGFATKVGERGVQLSGGQKQRVAIARAILKDPSILILDEATSSLDAKSEHLVQSALNELMKGRTTIIIAHRLSTIRDVDRIYVLNDGKVLESGTHEELVQLKDGAYNHLVSLQMESSTIPA
ncbi:ABC transporter ATP-binding protein [Xanthovirga aplysinae]|uniref:ABC transporter ATP-binding protein n=1 Tax=Xanthovirga aplysinae TaxID=2529853 RepID=UPI0012BD0D33|nr:ABC transporter transmembrane domain-containing protein [Xanthovirga aplysinae]MTI31446.1 ATP-binding cassette domain-containing protein [Xanthovirga aplysinae]